MMAGYDLFCGGGVILYAWGKIHPMNHGRRDV